jgi:hypothetical protein
VSERKRETIQLEREGEIQRERGEIQRERGDRQRELEGEIG